MVGSLNRVWMFGIDVTVREALVRNAPWEPVEREHAVSQTLLAFELLHGPCSGE